MNRTAASTNRSVIARPRSAVPSAGSRTPHTPVLDSSDDDVPFPVDSSLRPSARNTASAVGSPASTSGSIASRCAGMLTSAG